MRVMLVMSMSMASMIIVISLKGKRTTVRDLEAHHPSLQSGFHRSPLGHKIQKLIQLTMSSRRLDGGAYCGAPVGGKCMVSKAKLVLYAFAV